MADNGYEDTKIIEKKIKDAKDTIEISIASIKESYEFLATYRQRECLYQYTLDLNSFLEQWTTNQWK